MIGSSRAPGWGPLMDTFRRRFDAEPSLLVQAPGRVNLIGEHTDYNDGVVLPVAIDRHVRITARPNGSDAIRLYAASFDAIVEFPTTSPARPTLPPWARYAQGVAQQLVAHGGRLAGVDGIIGGDLPIGAGLSSSAALELAISLTFEQVSGHPLSARERALLCRTAEVEFVGVPCGLMDQFAITLCRRGHALFLDCRSLETHHIPLPTGLVVAICDTGVRRRLMGSAYATRRRECEEAVNALQAGGRTIQSLRDVAVDNLAFVEGLPDPLRRRARHVVTENARVIETARLLTGGEMMRLRDVFLASHYSLRDDYEVSSPELDAMVEAALASPGCVAARMTGAGFGGSAVALVRRAEQEEFLGHVAVHYLRQTGKTGTFFVTDAVDGAKVIESKMSS